MIKTFPFRLDIEKEYNNRMYSVNSNDLQTVKFTFVITDNGIPLNLTGLTVRIAIRKPDKKAVWQDCTITNAPRGEAEVILDNQAYIKKGEYEAELMLYKGTDTVAITQKFHYRAAEGIMNDKSLQSQTVLGPIDQKLSEVEETLNDIRKNGTGIDAQARQDIEEVTTQLAENEIKLLNTSNTFKIGTGKDGETTKDVSQTVANAFVEIELTGKTIKEGNTLKSVGQNGKVEIISSNNDGTLTDKKELILTNPLRSVPSGITDTVEKVANKWKLKRKVGSITLNGNQGLYINTANNGAKTIRAEFTITNAKNGIGADAMSDRYNIISDASATGDLEGVRFNGTTNVLYIRFSKTSIGYTEGDTGNQLSTKVKAYLKVNPVTVVYPLAAEIQEDVVDLSLQSWKNGQLSITSDVVPKSKHKVALSITSQAAISTQELQRFKEWIIKQPQYESEFYIPTFPTPDYSGNSGGLNIETMRVSDLYKMWDDLINKSNKYITKTIFGKDQSGEFDIWELHLKPQYPKYKLTIVGNIHGHGPYGDPRDVAVSLFHFFKDLTENHSINPTLQWLRHNVHFVLVPCANPWGFEYGNRNNSRGVDLNRNYGYNHDTDPVENKGPFPFSEIETQYVRDLLQSNKDAIGFLDVHCWMDNPIHFTYPAYHNGEQTISYRVTREVMNYLTTKNGASSDLMSPTFGASGKNYAEFICGIDSMTIEGSVYVTGKVPHSSEMMTYLVEWYGNIIYKWCADIEKNKNYLRSPNGTKYKLSVADDGKLSTVAF